MIKCILLFCFSKQQNEDIFHVVPKSDIKFYIIIIKEIFFKINSLDIQISNPFLNADNLPFVLLVHESKFSIRHLYYWVLTTEHRFHWEENSGC